MNTRARNGGIKLAHTQLLIFSEGVLIKSPCEQEGRSEEYNDEREETKTFND